MVPQARPLVRGRAARQPRPDVPEKRRVIIVTPGGLTQRGGMGRNMSDLVAAWGATAEAPQWRVLDSWPVEWRLRMSPVSPLYFAVALVRIIAARLCGRLDLLHVHMAGGGSMIRKGSIVWLGRALGVPVVLHLAGADIDTQFERCPRFAQVLLRRTLNRARFVIVLGRYWRDLLVNRVGVSPDRVVVIPNGVPEPVAAKPRRDGPCRILSLGRLGARKGTATALEALADPRIRVLDWTATLAGDGEVEAMGRLADRLGLHDRCVFPGWLERDEVSRLLQESDIFLLPSRQEGLPVALLEAMAHGLAIVSTRAGSIEDAITSGENGLLVPVDDREALTAALLTMLVCPEERQRFQQAARHRYRREFTASVFAERVLNLYRRCGL